MRTRTTRTWPSEGLPAAAVAAGANRADIAPLVCATRGGHPVPVATGRWGPVNAVQMSLWAAASAPGVVCMI